MKLDSDNDNNNNANNNNTSGSDTGSTIAAGPDIDSSDTDDDSSVTSISQEPVSILFASRSSMAKRDVWEIDLIRILDILMRILERSSKKDLRVAGMAAFSSSLIYRMKVETISALHKAAMERRSEPLQRTNPDIEVLGIPYRHESTYPVSLDDLLGLLQNLITTMANPVTRRRRRDYDADVDLEPPPLGDYLLSLESEIGAYRDMIMMRIAETGRGMLFDLTRNLELRDSIRCFFAALFLARDGIVDLEQVGHDIRIVAIPQTEGGDDNAGSKSDAGPDSTDNAAPLNPDSDATAMNS